MFERLLILAGSFGQAIRPDRQLRFQLVGLLFGGGQLALAVLEVAFVGGALDRGFEVFDGEGGFARFEEDLAQGSMAEVEQLFAAQRGIGGGGGLGGFGGTRLVLRFDPGSGRFLPVPRG